MMPHQTGFSHGSMAVVGPMAQQPSMMSQQPPMMTQQSPMMSQQSPMMSQQPPVMTQQPTMMTQPVLEHFNQGTQSFNPSVAMQPLGQRLLQTPYAPCTSCVGTPSPTAVRAVTVAPPFWGAR